MTTAIDLAKLVANHELAATLPPTVIPALLAEVERLKAALWMRLVTSLIDSARTNPEPAAPRLLTVPQVAELLGVPAGNLYAVVRRGELRAIRLGKYVRVDPAEFKKWLAQHQLADQVDGGLCHWYSPDHEGTRTPGSSGSARHDPGPARRPPRRHRERAGPVGTRGAPDLRARRPAGHAPGQPDPEDEG